MLLMRSLFLWLPGCIRRRHAIHTVQSNKSALVIAYRHTNFDFQLSRQRCHSHKAESQRRTSESTPPSVECVRL